MDQTPRPWHRTLYLPALAVVIALVAAASAWAAGSDPSEPDAAPAQYQPVQQDESAPPAQPDGDRRGGHDCPEGEQDGDGSGSAQPAPDTTPDAATTPDV